MMIKLNLPVKVLSCEGIGNAVDKEELVSVPSVPFMTSQKLKSETISEIQLVRKEKVTLQKSQQESLLFRSELWRNKKVPELTICRLSYVGMSSASLDYKDLNDFHFHSDINEDELVDFTKSVLLIDGCKN